MESALCDLKKICDEVKDTLDPVILSSIESLIDKTYNALSNENEDARNLLEETLMRGVELVQKSKVGKNSLDLDFPDPESFFDVDESNTTEDSSSEANEEERCDSPVSQEYVENFDMLLPLRDIEEEEDLSLKDLPWCVAEEHSYSIKSQNVNLLPNGNLSLDVGEKEQKIVGSFASKNLEKLEECSKVLNNTSKVRKVLKSSHWTNPFVHRVSTATSTGLPKYMFTPRSGQIKSGVYKASTTTSVKPTYKAPGVKSVKPEPPSPPSVPVPGPCSLEGGKLKECEHVSLLNSGSDGLAPLPMHGPQLQPIHLKPSKSDASTATDTLGLEPLGGLVGAPPPPPVPAPAGSGADPPNTVVTKYSHQWTLSHFSKKMKLGVGKSIDSMFFSITVQGKKTDWSLMLYPNGDKDKVSGYVSLYLTCRNRKGLPMSLEFKFTILDAEGKTATAPTKSGSITAQMLASNSSWGWESFVKHSELKDKYVRDLLPKDKLTIMCDITLKCEQGDLKHSTRKREDTTDSRDIDQLVNFVGELDLEAPSSKGKKKTKKNKTKRSVKEEETLTEEPNQLEHVNLPTPLESNSPQLQKVEGKSEVSPDTSALTLDTSSCKEDEEVEQLLVEEESSNNDHADGEVFQVVTRRRTRKTSEKSGNGLQESPLLKQHSSGRKSGHSRSSPSSKQKKTKPAPVPKVTQAETAPVPGPDPPAPAPPSPTPLPPTPALTPSTPCEPPFLSGLGLHTKESLEGLLDTKSLLEENLLRLSELVDNKAVTIKEISRDKVLKLANISQKQMNLKARKSELESRKVEAESLVVSLSQEIGEVETLLRRESSKAARLSLYLDMNLSDAEGELDRLRQEKEALGSRLSQVEDKLRGNRLRDRLTNIHTQIQRLQANLECPICFKTAMNPIFQCSEGHLICSSCVRQVVQCATCRQPGAANIRNRYAEKDCVELSRLLDERQEIMKELTS